MESLKSKIFILLILVLAFNTSAFLLYAYSSLLDFFPWGNSDSYVIWEPLVLYFLVPPLILIGWVVIILSKQRKHGLFGFHLLIIGVGFTLPSIFGFDLRTDVAGRWCGVIVAAIGTLLTMIDVLIIIKGKGIASFTR